MNEESISYFNGDEMASNVWLGKYAEKGETSPDQMHRRMAKEFARVEFEFITKQEVNGAQNLSKRGQELWEKRMKMTLSDIEEEYYNLFKGFKYIVPQGSVMSTLGTDVIASLSNCYVVASPYDSYSGIHKTDGDLIFYYKRRGGVGVDISKLRPVNTATNNTARTTTGAVSFMRRFSNTTREVAMNGRRGALMISIDVNHPDVMDFIKIKRDGTSVTGANISVRLNNEFMKAVENDGDYILRFPTDKNIKGGLKEPSHYEPYGELIKFKDKDGSTYYTKRIKAKQYWDELIKSARDFAEPGLMYWDTVLDKDPASVYEQYIPISSNPCGEQFLNANDSCRLTAMNLFSFVDKPFTPEAKINYDKLYEVSYQHARIGDNLVELEMEHIQRIIDKIKSDPEPDNIKQGELKLWEESYKKAGAGRRTGLGITALADMLAGVGVKYDSDEGLEIIDKVMHTKMEAELDCNIDLALLRGHFEGWDSSKEFNEEGGANTFYQMLLENFPEQAERMKKYGRRSVNFSTIAPTGSLSILTQTTSGCEPLFKSYYIRRKKINPNEEGVRIDFTDESGDNWQEFPVLHPKFKDWVIQYIGKDDLSELSEEGLKELFNASPWFGSTADDINSERRVEIQAVLQKYTTNAISSTINLPNTVTYKDVSDIYMNGWKHGLKGQTIYVDGSRSGVLVTNDKKEETTTKFHDNHAPRRPKRMKAKLVRFNNNKEKWIAFVGLMDNKPYEIFTGRLEDIKIPMKVEEGEIVKIKDDEGNRRYDFEYEDGTLEGINKVFNDDFWNYAKLISGILRHGMPLHYAVDMVSNLSFEEDHINTWKNGVARTLKKFIPDGKAEGLKCDSCGSTDIIFEEGCSKCTSCGSSKCS